MLEFEVDGKRVVHVGDQQGWASAVKRKDGFYHNYVYQNRFKRGEMIRAAGYFRDRRPDTIISGHWETLQGDDALFAVFEKAGCEQRRLHESLLPVDEIDWDSDGIGAVIYPYRIEIPPKVNRTDLELVVRNPFDRNTVAAARIIAPPAWGVVPEERHAAVEPLEETSFSFSLTVPEEACVRNQPIAADITIDGKPFGQIAEALVTVHWPESTHWGGGVWWQKKG
jgi:hypothetical protein